MKNNIEDVEVSLPSTGIPMCEGIIDSQTQIGNTLLEGNTDR